MEDRPSRLLAVLLLLLVVGLITAIYAPSLVSDFVTWDDPNLVYLNPVIAEFSPSSLKTIFATYDPKLYIPLTRLTYQIDHALWGFTPLFFHLTNLLLHIGNALLVFWLFFLWTRRTSIAFLGALFFGIHPINVEAVSWVSARKDVLSTPFFLLSLIGYCYFRSSGFKKYYLACLLAFLLALLSKPMAITLPIILLLVDFREEREMSWRVVMEKWQFFLLSIIFGIVTIFGFQSDTETGSFLLRFLVSARAIVLYLWHFLFPVGLSAMYPFPHDVRLLSAEYMVPFIILATLAWFVFYSQKWSRNILFGFLFFLVTLFPTLIKSSSMDNTVFAADRYAYLPSIGLLFVAGYLFPKACRVPYKLCLIRSLAISFLVVWGVLFLFFASDQVQVWKNSETLYRDIVEKQPDASIAHANLGAVYLAEGRLEEARESLQAALAIRPRYIHARNNLGVVYWRLGLLNDARLEFERVLAGSPTTVKAQFNLGLVYKDLGMLDQAIEALQKVIALNPDHAKAHKHLGELYSKKGMYEEGVLELRRAMELEAL